MPIAVRDGPQQSERAMNKDKATPGPDAVGLQFPGPREKAANFIARPSKTRDRSTGEHSNSTGSESISLDNRTGNYLGMAEMLASKG